MVDEFSTERQLAMHDPLEGVTSNGAIATGVSRNRVPASFESAVDAAISAIGAADAGASLYLYGSVATGMAKPPKSDIDLLTVGIPQTAAAEIADVLSLQFSDLCRTVEIAAAQPSDFVGETDAAYGGRVFLKHYCAHLIGPDLHSDLPEFAADHRAARGFNGDIADHAKRWRAQLREGNDPAVVARRLARKTLLAVAGLVSVHDEIWTTDRATAATRWAEVRPDLDGGLQMLTAWAGGRGAPGVASIEAALDGVVAQVTGSFESMIGLW